jgi:predicted TIM-barrel fold metal-dependent hydrolase
MNMTRFAVPSRVLPYAGRILDIDSHESTPMNRWPEQFGSVVDELLAAVSQSTLAATRLRDADDTEINADTVWNRKSSEAPGSFDFDRRLAVLDLTGVKRQMIFPGGMGLLALGLYASADDSTVFKAIAGDRRGYARKLLDAYNDFCARVAQRSDRLRPVAVLFGDSPEELCNKVRTLLRRGVRAVWIPSGSPPAGVSPADPVLDPLWDLLSAGGAAVLAHIGDQSNFLSTTVWRNAPAFEGYKVGGEFSLDPWTLSSFHLAAQNFIGTMVLGGVFDRHPMLRVGCCELGAGWLGPLAANLDLWNENSRALGQRGVTLVRLRERPSDYIRRNVRIAGFDFEDIGSYIRLYGLDDVYCYASDYPHVEGGTAPMTRFSDSVAEFGPRVLQKFFTENGAWLLPD